MKQLIRLVLVAAILPFLMASSPREDAFPKNPTLSKYFFSSQNESSVNEISEKYEITRRVGDGFEVIVPEKEQAEFLKLAPNAELLEIDISARFKNRESWEKAGYHTFDTVKTDLEKIVSEHSEIATLSQYGKSMEGRPLWALKLVTPVGINEKKSEVAISAATHGNELVTVEVLFGLLNQLISEYGKNSRITKMLDTHVIYFLPVINPDGYVRQERYANGIDPNRDYPWPEKPDRKPNPAIKAVMNFYAEHNIKGSIDYHSTGGMIMFPWAYTYNEIESTDYKDLDKLTARMAESNGYEHGPISKVIYVAKGSSADYYYWKHKTKALGIEISREGSPSSFAALTEENRESTWRFIESF